MRFAWYWACLLTTMFVGSARAADTEPKLLPQELLDEGWIELFDG